jgi:hypothetical protein
MGELIVQSVVTFISISGLPIQVVIISGVVSVVHTCAGLAFIKTVLENSLAITMLLFGPGVQINTFFDLQNCYV